jgi:hypothetical protein
MIAYKEFVWFILGAKECEGLMEGVGKVDLPVWVPRFYSRNLGYPDGAIHDCEAGRFIKQVKLQEVALCTRDPIARPGREVESGSELSRG